MKWVLVSDKGKVSLFQGKTLGRADFPDAIALSRKHAQFTIHDDQIYVTDLGSTNGTILRGQPLKPNIAKQMQPGDVVCIGNLQFILQKRTSSGYFRTPTTIPGVLLGVFAIHFGLAILRPSLGWGLALGLGGFLALFVWMLSSVVISAVICDLAWKRLGGRTMPRYAAAVFVTTIGVSYGLMKYADSDWKLNEFLIQNQVEYFCLHSFNAPRCIASVNNCPRCARDIVKWKRDLMVQKLRPYQEKLAARAAQVQSPRQPAASTPAPAPSHR